MDLVMVVDASGDSDSSGSFATLKKVTKELARKYLPAEDFTKIGVVTFAQTATTVTPLTGDANSLPTEIESGLVWQESQAARLAPGLMEAQGLLRRGGRRNAFPVVLVITHGWIADPWMARNAARRLHARVVVAQLGVDHRSGYRTLSRLTSAPREENLIQLKSLPTLTDESGVNEATNKVILGTCSSVAAV
jgi:Mg-chelatase subunit ChlD